MLSGLIIRDIVLIERLELAFKAGLCVLTGETGAGKSILLDALGLALGMRAEASLVRHGAEQGSVSASFTVPADHPANALLREQGLAPETELVLRRMVGADGRSRGFVNDQPISVGLLRRLGGSLVEIHGQSEEQGLLDSATHRTMLDAFAGLAPQLDAVRAAHAAMRASEAAFAETEAAITLARRDEDYLRHALQELERLDPKPDEEAALAARRTLLMHGEKVAEALRDAAGALEESGGVESRLRAAERAVERVAERAGGRLAGVLLALERAQVEAAEATAALAAASRDLDLDPAGLERLEERLFALRALARKHNCQVDALPALRQEFAGRLAAVEDGGDRLAALGRQRQQAIAAYRQAAEALSQARGKAATRLDKAVMGELMPLKLGAAKFRTQLTRIEEAEWSAQGIDRVSFLVATNPGAAPGPLAKIASGGELSRFMLALKVVLARQGSAPTLVFDEVDHGVGGATAAAVGERLARLAKDLQVLVVTHSPQVAARGDYHWRVAKAADGSKGKAITQVMVSELSRSDRHEEIARMLAGATVTAQARAAAESLLLGDQP